MAEKLLKYYRYIYDLKGLEGKLALAKITDIPSLIAAMEPDSEENIKIFKDAVKQVTGKNAPDF